MILFLVCSHFDNYYILVYLLLSTEHITFLFILGLSEDDNLSECSDVEEEGYADFTKDDLEPFISQVEGMQLKPTNSDRVKQKFDNHQQVKQIILSLTIS